MTKRVIPTYRTYKFTDQDPMVDKVRTAVSDSGMTNADIAAKSGVSSQTLRNWWNERTMRPQFATLNAVARSCGHELQIVPVQQKAKIPARRKVRRGNTRQLETLVNVGAP